MLAFFLGASAAFAHGDAFEHDAGAESAFAVVSAGVAEIGVDAVLLAPFEEFALEVHFFLSHGVEVDVGSDHAVGDEPVAILESAVEIDGSHECFKSVSANVGVAHACALCGLDECFESHLLGESVERFALYDFRACGGEEAFALVLEVAEEYVADYGFEHGVAEIFESLVVERLGGVFAAWAFVATSAAAVFRAVGVGVVAERLVGES